MTVLVDLRKIRGLSQKSAAKKIGISQSMLAMMETNERSGSDDTKRKVAKFYGKSVGYIFFRDDITLRDKQSQK